MSLYNIKNPYDSYSDELYGGTGSVIGRCEQCGASIEIGDRYLDIDGAYYCECCVDDMTKSDILELAGLSIQTADFD